ncbi:7-cyano-7-deazaguanine synthase QueC [Desulfuribacillus stibiiarsenatis]|uniref:7-cyano-7-deazaguanine synthase n=2 Tax=Desulfuribacillus stibiiarsenatis TaxID=1390249 RepID=A0A1E5L7L1_9FIRM|nr:7-cyano-7-deazaguanine synthase QueC [Desulfuribacillus stibiiarsenatis]
MGQAAVILLSSGIDSFTSLAIAKEKGYEVQLALTVNYGQKAALREIMFAELICKHYGVPHKVLDVQGIMNGVTSGLTTNDVPNIAQDQLDDMDLTTRTAKKVWVPNRNGLLINIAATYAENLGCEWVITGFNREEAVTFPDNSDDFVHAINQSLYYSTSNHVQVISFTQSMTKQEIIDTAVNLQVPLEYVWSCYHGNELMCGTCESCQRLKRAISKYPMLVSSIKFTTE